MIRQIYRMLILLWTTLLIVLPFRAVVSFSGRSPSPHSQHKHSTCVHPSSGIFGTSSTDRRQSHHQAKAGNDDDAFDDDYYYPSTPRSAGTSPISSSPRPPRQPNSRDNTKVKYDEYYYEDDDEEEEGLPFREPLRTSGENEKLARYQSQQELDAYEDDEDYYYDDEDEDDEEEYDYDDEEEDSESSSFGGNFWSNPTGGIDRSKRPPTPQSPRVTSPRRRREDESYDPRSTRRRRSPVRSGGLTKAPEKAAKDFYDRLFWYGFDPDDSEQVGDRTVFGGTKGKFDGLAFLQASDSSPSRQIRSRQEQRQLPPTSGKSKRQSFDDEEEEEEDDDDYYDEGESITSSRKRSNPTQRTPPDDYPSPREGRGEGRRNRAEPAPRRRRRRPREYDSDDFDNADGGLMNGGDWVSKQVSSWFSGNENENDEDRSSERQGRRRQRSSGGELSPFNVLNTFFGVDTDDMAYKADMYNAKMGLGPKRRSRGSPDSSKRTSRRQARDNPGRPGYAYRYNAEDDTDDAEASFIVDVEPMVLEDGSLDDKSNDDEPNSAQEGNEDASQRGKELTWEERALAVERVPPSEIPGWGPSGELPVDGRTKAIIDALEDIQTARQKVETREKKEALAKEEITILKVDAELQRRQLEESRSNARGAQERLRQIELDIDGASRVLRRARTKVQLARDQLEELQARHWAVLGFYNPAQAEEMVAEALNEFQLSESLARPVDDLTTAGEPVVSSQDVESATSAPPPAQSTTASSTDPASSS